MDPANDIDQSAAGPELDPEVAAGTWVVIPVYNEESVIAGVVAEVQRTFPNVVAVDDAYFHITYLCNGLLREVRVIVVVSTHKMLRRRQRP